MAPTKLYKFSSHFRLDSRIGVGGYGVVWKCIDVRSNTPRAVKIVHDKICTRKSWSPEHCKRIPDEAALWLPLSHSNLVTLLDLYFHPTTNYWFFVMEYDPDYIDLFDYLGKEGTCDSSKSRKIAQQIISVLTYLHSAGVDHRDIKDESILINPSTLHIKLFDFGSASKLQPNTPYTGFQGTDLYLPPEFHRFRTYYPLPAAVWSIGCLVHCLLVGDSPFKNKAEIRSFVKLDWGDKGDELAWDFVQRCMTREPEERVKMEDLLKLRWFSDAENISPTL